VALTGALGWLGLSVAALWLPLIAIRGLAGATSAPLHPGAARSVSLWIPLSGRATANGLVTAGALIGIAVSYPGFGWLMDRLDWPLAFVLCGAALMLFALVWSRLATDGAVSHPWANSAERELSQSCDVLPTHSAAPVDEFLGLFRNRQLVLLTISYAFVGYFEYLFFYWIGYYFKRELKLPVEESRQAAFTVTMAMAVGMTIGGVCSDWLCRRVGSRWGYRGVALAGMGLCALFGWVGVSAEVPSHVVALFSLALGSLGMCEGVFWTTAPLFQKRSGGLACAFLNTLGNAVGLLAPVFTPWIGKRFGWIAAIDVACVLCAVGAVIWLWIDPDARYDSSREPLDPVPVEL
jgi:MFS family permease